MGQALETFCHVVDRLRALGALDTPTSFDGDVLEGAVSEIRSLQASRDRLFFEVQILQMTQGALKMEIDRLRAEHAAVAPTVCATGALLTFKVDGSVELSADALQITGDVVPA